MSRDLHLRFIMSLDQIQHSDFFLDGSPQDKRSKNEFSIIVIISHCYPSTHGVQRTFPDWQIVSLSFVVSHGISDDPSIEHLIKNLQTGVTLFGIFFAYWCTVNQSTMGQNQVILRHLIIHSPMSLGVSE